MTKPSYAAGDVPTASDVNEFFVNCNLARKSVAESVTSSTTLQDDDVLTLAVSANAIYVVECVLLYDGAAQGSGAGDLKVGFTAPASSSFEGIVVGLTPTASTSSDDATAYVVLGTSNNLGTVGSGTTVAGKFSGVLTTAGSAGNFTVQWAQVTSSATATRVLANSYLELRRKS